MLQITDIKSETVVATIASGKLSQHDLEKIHPLIHSILEKGLKVRWYFEMNDFHQLFQSSRKPSYCPVWLLNLIIPSSAVGLCAVVPLGRVTDVVPSNM